MGRVNAPLKDPPREGALVLKDGRTLYRVLRVDHLSGTAGRFIVVFRAEADGTIEHVGDHQLQPFRRLWTRYDMILANEVAGTDHEPS